MPAVNVVALITGASAFVLQALPDILTGILSELNKFVSQHAGLVVSIGCFASLITALWMTKIRRGQKKLISTVDNIENILDEKFDQYTQTLLDGYIGIKELREKLERVRGE